jgi:hypothetical protein
MNRALGVTGDELVVRDDHGVLRHLHIDEADAVLA